MSVSPRPPLSPGFMAAFEREAGRGRILPFDRFVALALYDPLIGYYTGKRRRIGRLPAADFFTASSLGVEFGALVAEACTALLRPGGPAAHTFVEIGAEAAPTNAGAQPSSGSVLTGVAHSFAAATSIALGQSLAIPSPAVVFSNELFDAQPFHRLIWRDGTWRETGVVLREGALEEVELPEPAEAIGAIRDRLPPSAPEGYRIDLPLAAATLAARIAALPWVGLFVAFDYGTSWATLAADTPAGTARAYHRHRQSDDLLAQPGEQDLTCHVCWDWIAAELAARGFAEPSLESQEAFLVHYAAPALRAITEADSGRFSARKLGVLQLLHSGNMGRKFQVLWARRDRMPTPAPR